MHICIDACFKLVRKNKGANHKRVAEASTIFWVDQEEVDFCATSADDQTQDERECSNFAAGNNLIAKRRNRSCMVTGVIGFNCRHHHPGLYADMKAGER